MPCRDPVYLSDSLLYNLYPLVITNKLSFASYLVEVDLMSIELGAVDTYKASLAADFHAASTAHTGAVDHDSIERHNGRHVVFLLSARPQTSS